MKLVFFWCPIQIDKAINIQVKLDFFALESFLNLIQVVFRRGFSSDL